MIPGILQTTRRFVQNEDGPTAVEYAVLLALIIVGCIATITTLGANANGTFGSVAGVFGGGSNSTNSIAGSSWTGEFGNDTLSFGKDGSFTQYNMDGTVYNAGNYTMNGSTGTINFTSGAGAGGSVNLSTSGNTMTWTDQNGTAVGIFNKGS